MNFNPLGLLSKLDINMNIQGKISQQAADRAALRLAWAASIALMVLALSIGFALVAWVLGWSG
ncbi:hypothetical protein A7P92_06500 [Eikenella corrodens]|uniref:hypothetical protein n=1 Tax=Eikenella corrodens TaxID=539 RepID=UPI0007D075B0|nr:hypothetical protein [Eikenella corrodens]OAM23722.1 hypothetical protein A7P92_06500 [Eikenella corrodens]